MNEQPDECTFPCRNASTLKRHFSLFDCTAMLGAMKLGFSSPEVAFMSC